MVSIFTDASYFFHSKVGGWAAIIYFQYKTVEIFGGETSGDINRMELLAIVKALSTLPPNTTAIVYTDSQYVLRGKSQFKKLSPNDDLWKQLDELRARHNVSIRWVKAHSGNQINDRVDSLARKATIAQIKKTQRKVK